MDNGFTFDGRHSLRDMGLIAIRDKKRVIAAGGSVVSYAIGGRQGTMAYGDQQTLQEYSRAVTLYDAGILGSETAATARWHQAVAWLTVGRRKLVWDDDPGLYVPAEVTEMVGDDSSWLEEGLRVTFRLQPLRRSMDRDTAETVIADGDSHAVALQAVSQLPAPVCADITVQGSQHLTGAEITLGSRAIVLRDMDAAPGDVVRISTEEPAGADILRGGKVLTSALPCAERFELLEGVGALSPVIRLSFAGASGASASCVLSARGVWR